MWVNGRVDLPYGVARGTVDPTVVFRMEKSSHGPVASRRVGRLCRLHAGYDRRLHLCERIHRCVRSDPVNGVLGFRAGNVESVVEQREIERTALSFNLAFRSIKYDFVSNGTPRSFKNIPIYRSKVNCAATLAD